MAVADLDLVEVRRVFASVVMSWASVHSERMTALNSMCAGAAMATATILERL